MSFQYIPENFIMKQISHYCCVGKRIKMCSDVFNRQGGRSPSLYNTNQAYPLGEGEGKDI